LGTHPECGKKRFLIKTLSGDNMGDTVLYNVDQVDHCCSCCCGSGDWVLKVPESDEILATYTPASCKMCGCSDWHVYKGSGKDNKIAYMSKGGCCEFHLKSQNDNLGKFYEIHKGCYCGICLSLFWFTLSKGMDAVAPGSGSIFSELRKCVHYACEAICALERRVTNIPVEGVGHDHAMFYQKPRCCLCCTEEEYLVDHFALNASIDERIMQIGLNVYLFTDLAKANKAHFGKEINPAAIADDQQIQMQQMQQQPQNLN
jgi:hypothetical protein